jgi:hypothetical protein
MCTKNVCFYLFHDVGLQLILSNGCSIEILAVFKRGQRAGLKKKKSGKKKKRL